MAFHPQQPLQQIPAYGYCDSFFVENHDEDGIYARAAMERERAQDAARIKQKALAIELSQVTAEEYQVDVLKHMERMEVFNLTDGCTRIVLTRIRRRRCLTFSQSRFRPRFNGS